MDIIYIRSPSKKQLNEQLAAGVQIIGTVHHRDGCVQQRSLERMLDCSVVKLYSVTDGVGNPVARSYGVWNAKKKRVD